ncbi:MAG TPA: MFS transporter [Streptosporangiaceae bacterium]|jgi:predicted MFS family arabinose efflux permease
MTSLRTLPWPGQDSAARNPRIRPGGDQGPAGSRARLSRPLAFAAIAAIALLFTATSAAPSPLYVVYQQEWGFSATMLTVIFGVYAIGLIGALLTLGALSDHVGRRPVLGLAIGLEAAALVLFLLAADVPVLLLARFVQGVATGAAITTLGAALVDLNPPHAPGRARLINSIVPTTGLALGSLGSGALIQFAPAPTRLVYALLLAGMAAAAVAVAVMPETAARRPGAVASLAPRLAVPARVRAEFYALVPITVSCWALGGLFFSLGPSDAASLFGLTSHLIGGLVVTLLCGAGAVTTFAVRRWPAGRILTMGAVVFIAGTAVLLGGVQAGSAGLAGAGTLVAGVGFGACFLGSFGALSQMAGPGERSELFAVGYVIAYLSLSLPTVLAGLASTSFGLRSTTLGYGAAVSVLGLVALGAQRVTARRAGVSGPVS